MSAPQHIGSAAPFRTVAKEMWSKGWAVVPLPKRRKKSPPEEVTGRQGRIPTSDDIEKWLDDDQWTDSKGNVIAIGNIAIRAGRIIVIDGKDYEAIGIDVDAYKDKHGKEHLRELEKRFGPLPNTWSSSARADGISGIRWYLVPAGYEFMGKPRMSSGKASDSIEIVQRVHRYGVCFPSFNPDANGQYYWYPIGQACDGVHFSPRIPRVNECAFLPDSWFQFLTRGGTEAQGNVPMDMELELEELDKWAKKCLVDGNEMCPTVEKAYQKHCDTIGNASDHHDPIVAAHWHLLNLGAEGHTGWNSARIVCESAWLDRVSGDNSRSLFEAQGELVRSREGALRKLKGQYDEYRLAGVQYLVDMDPCDGGPARMGGVASGASAVGAGSAGGNGGKGAGSAGGGNGGVGGKLNSYYEGIDPNDYDKNDRGQAEHFLARVGDTVHHISDYNAWVIFDGQTWKLDEDIAIKDRFVKSVVIPSKRRAKGFGKQSERLVSSGVPTNDPRIVKLKKDRIKLEQIAEMYGNDRNVKAALNMAKTLPGVSFRYNQLNWNTSILAMPGGKVLQLDSPGSKADPKGLGYKVVSNEKSFFTTLATGVDYVPFRDVPEKEAKLWKGYLDLFLPGEPALDDQGKEILDYSYRRFVQKALGYILIGGNPNKIGIFLVGKRDSGKTTMVKALQAALGSYATTFQPSAVFKDNSGGNNPELGNLLHCRGIFSSEAGSQRIHANPFKRNTGGDKISVTRKYANEQIIGEPQFVPVVATNQPPTVEDADEALIKRILVLRFNKSVPEAQNDRHMDSVIETHCRHAVLSWLVSGYRAYIREGLDWSNWHPISREATKLFAVELNDVSAFINETCAVADDLTRERLDKVPGSEKAVEFHNTWMQVTCKELYAAYRQEFQGDKGVLSSRAFVMKVKQLFGIDWKHTRAGGEQTGRWIGLKWKSSEMSRVQTSSSHE